jgi:NADH-quinone oxidoreductase subunit J
MERIIFYILSAVTVIGTLCAITARQAVRAIVYLVTSFFALALIFYLLGAPFVAALEVIIYAGAIMVLFLFVIMMVELASPEKLPKPTLSDWWPALALVLVVVASLTVLVAGSAPPVSRGGSHTVRQFTKVLFTRYGVAIELVSMQLLFALVGALYLGRRR